MVGEARVSSCVQGVSCPLLFARTSAGPMVGMARMMEPVIEAQGG